MTSPPPPPPPPPPPVKQRPGKPQPLRSALIIVAMLGLSIGAGYNIVRAFVNYCEAR